MNVTDHPHRHLLKAYEVEVHDGHELHKITVRDSWFQGKKPGAMVEIMTTTGDKIIGEFVRYRPIRSGV